MKNILLLLLVLCLLSSCTSRLYRILNKNGIGDERFVEVIPFTYENGLPLIEVEIDGKTYNFLFDTGAPVVIDKRLVELVNFKEKKKYNVTDTHGKSQKEVVGSIETLKLGAQEFHEVGAFVMDLRKSEVLACFQLDGIIGANLMAQCKWIVDYSAQTMTFQHPSISLPESPRVSYITFAYKNAQRTPIIDLSILGKKIEDVTFDTGFNGMLSLNSEMHQDILDQITEKVYVSGTSSYSVYGAGYDETMIYGQVGELLLDTTQIKNIIIKFSKKKSQLLGNSILENYKIYLDWEKNRIGFQPYEKEPTYNLQGYGLSIRPESGKLYVTSLVQNSIAAKIGLELNDEILEINGTEVSTMSSEEQCNILLTLRLHTGEDMKIITQRGEVRQSYILKYQTFLTAEK